MFPHTESISLQGAHAGFNFSPVEKHVKVGTTIKIGRKVEKDPNRSKNQKKKSSSSDGNGIASVLVVGGEERQLTDGNMSDVNGDAVGGDELREASEMMMDLDVDVELAGQGARTELVKQDFIAFR
ncbi:hypothetical protein HK096_005060, partial [Nowakowskiella sp. JEL0078]